MLPKIAETTTQRIRCLNEDFKNALALKVGEISLPTTIEKKGWRAC